MKWNVLWSLFFAFWACLAGWQTAHADVAERRVPWTQSRINGSPDPPLPLVLERVYPQLDFNKPVSLHAVPTANRLVVCEQGGKIYSFPADGDPSRADLIADFTDQRPPFCEVVPGDGRRIEIFSLAFHPKFETNRKVVICYVVQGRERRLTDGTHIASFELSAAEPFAVDIASERTILRFDSGGHNGCTVAFDNDGLLYISTGDVASPTPPDPFDHGQNVGDLYSAILRVDMDRPTGDLGYAIPADNPFVDFAGARPEVYAYGFRNPWRMSFDRSTGDLWVGDVGWEAWEMVYRVRSGGNYGWPIKEGPGDARPDARPGPTPIIPADIALPHSEAASVTGGVVYRGSKLPGIHGHYVFGDWVTRKFWAVASDEKTIHSLREIAVGPVKPICFELDHDGELLILDYNSAGTSGIYRMAANPMPTSETPFPTRLSETGLVSSTDPLVPASGVVPYKINAPMWRDGAATEYWLAIPGNEQATFHQRPQTTFDWFRTKVTLPPGSVLVKTYWLETVVGDPHSRRPVETQIAHNMALSDWNYYTFRWTEDQSDAILVAAGGEIAELDVIDAGSPEGRIRLNWSFAARSQCRTCHTPWRGEALAFTELQLRDRRSGTDSWRNLLADGLIITDTDPAPKDDDEVVTIVSPYDENHSIELRARSYLHANCGHCHIQGGNSSAAFDVSFEKPLQDTGLINAVPMRGDAQLDDARLIAAGAPERSVLLYRMAKLGSGRMPPIGTNRVDHFGVNLLSRWISDLDASSPDHASPDTTSPDTASPKVAERSRNYHRWLDQLVSERPEGGDSGGSAQDHDAPKDVLTAGQQLLESTSGGLLLASAIAEGRIDQRLHQRLIDQAMRAPPQIAELFEPWIGESGRVARLGSGFDPQQLLEITGDAEAGRQLFLAGRGQCAQCHQIHGQGLAIGPDLSKIGSKHTRPADLLHHINDPSAEIAEPYRAVTLLSTSGQVFTGRVLQRSETTIQLQDPSGRLQRIDPEDVELEKPADKSMMPEQLLDAFTAQQAADLLRYLSELK